LFAKHEHPKTNIVTEAGRSVFPGFMVWF